MLLLDIVKLIKNADITIADVQRAVNYLKLFGYLKQDGFTLDEFIFAVKKFQEFFQIDGNGTLDAKTIRAMASFRCGVPESMTEDARGRWNKSNVTFSVHKFVDGLTQEKQEELLIKAFEQWEEVANIKFTYIGRGKPADINIKSANRGNGLGGSGGTLAYAYLPQGNNEPLDLVFDLAETWIDDPARRGILYLNVACHEIGHNLGLTHSSKKGALMAPFYAPGVSGPQQNDDVPRIQSIYGKPQNDPNPPPPPPPPPPNPSNKTTIEIVGAVDSIAIPGYRVIKI